MKNILIVHFSPIELYPPIQNLIKFLEQELEQDVKVTVLTTHTNVKELSSFKLNSNRLKIIKLDYTGSKICNIKRYINYFIFNICSLGYLISIRPSSILYYETISSYPVYLYKRYINSKVKIFAHFHEYVSIPEYRTGMLLLKYFYSCEKWLFPKLNWLSHTNNFRLQLFLADIKPLTVSNPKILPNYPSKKWAIQAEKCIRKPLKVVYIGSLSIDTMYTIEFAEWVINQKGNVIWDIYSYNITVSAKYYLLSKQSAWINLKAGVNYNKLPGILQLYDIGLVIYKGHLPNYVYNIPNKLYEYAVCGLDVWLPDKMIGSLALKTKCTFPKILALDFENLDKINVDEIISRENLNYAKHNYFYEESLKEIVYELNEIDT